MEKNFSMENYDSQKKNTLICRLQKIIRRARPTRLNKFLVKKKKLVKIKWFENKISKLASENTFP